jgi:hypothetical protein
MTKSVVIFGALALSTIVGCRKDVDMFRPYQPSSGELNAFLSQNLAEPAAQTDFGLNKITDDQVLVTPKGTRIFLVDTDNLFADTETGAPVPCSTCPDLKVSVTEVFSKAEMLGRGLNTVGNDGELFESNGMFRIAVSCNGRSLSLLSGRTLKVQVPNNAPQDGFVVLGKTDGVDTWVSLNQQVYVAEWPLIGGGIQNGHELVVKELGWVANGRYLGPQSLSKFCISVPLGFGDQNTLAYLSFDNRPILAPLTFDLPSNSFCYPFAPTGFPVQVVAVSKLGQQYWAGKAQTETGSSGTSFPLETKTSTEQAVINLLKGL